MENRLEGKVAVVTGAARGQGRAHAVRFAQEGADVIALDICAQIDSNPYPLATREDLAETERLVKETGRQILASQVDVRERRELRDAIDAGVAQLGRLDVVVANAGILPMAMGDPEVGDFVDAADVDLIGVMNTVSVSLPHLGDGSSIVVTGSTAGLVPGAADNPIMGPGGAGYGWSKRTLVSYVEEMALQLASRFIRINAMHPSNCNTHLLHNEGLYGLFRPDLEAPTREDAEVTFAFFQAMPIPYVETEDVANLALFLASDESRYITGQQISVDGGALIKARRGAGM